MAELSRKAEKRRLRKEKKRKKYQQKLEEEKIQFNVINLLKTQKFDTKPNVAQFLKDYVEMIRCVIGNGKIQIWPEQSYDIAKVIVRFLDGHELIYDKHADNVIKNKFYYYDNLVEIVLKASDIEAVDNFFQQLFNFKFVY